jgi:hypothetical protein
MKTIEKYAKMYLTKHFGSPHGNKPVEEALVKGFELSKNFDEVLCCCANNQAFKEMLSGAEICSQCKKQF